MIKNQGGIDSIEESDSGKNKRVQTNLAALEDVLSIKPVELNNQDGFIYWFVEYFNKCSGTVSKNIPMSAAISLLSTAISNRIVAYVGENKSRPITPNLYMMLSAPSGTGKEFCQQVISDCFSGTKLLGAGNYASSTSIFINLPFQQERLDIIDEAQGFFRKLSGKETFERDISTVLCKLFSAASSAYNGAMIVSKNTKDPIGACHQPHVSILALGVPSIEETFKKHLFTDGLLPRFIYLKETNRKRDYTVENYKMGHVLKADLVTRIRAIDSILPKVLDIDYEAEMASMIIDTEKKDEVSKGNRYKPFEVTFTKQAAARWNDFRRACDELYLGELLDPAGQRMGELAARLALIHAVSRVLYSDFGILKESIRYEDVEFGIAIACESVRNYRESLSNQFEGLYPGSFSDRSKKLLDFFKLNPNKEFTSREIRQNCRIFKTDNDCPQLLDELEDLGLIKNRYEVSSNNKKVIFYSLVK